MSEQENPSTELAEVDTEYVANFPSEDVVSRHRLAVGEVPAGSTAMVGAGNSQTAALMAQGMAQMELQMKMAMSFPRNHDQVTVNIAMACKNPEFADKALYSYQQGRDTISGPSIKLAEEMARHWGNMNSGFFQVSDTETHRTVRAWAWDMQANMRREMDVTFGKSVPKRVNGQTQWVQPNEVELLRLTNQKAAIGVRNMILACLPDQLKRDAVSWCKQTLSQKDAADPEAFKKKMMNGFAQVGVSPAELHALIGRDLKTLRMPADAKLVEFMRGVYNRLDRGEATFHEILRERAEAMGVDGPPPSSAAELRERVNKRANASAGKKGG